MDTADLPDSGCTEAGQQVGSQVLVGGVGSMGGLWRAVPAKEACDVQGLSAAEKPVASAGVGLLAHGAGARDESETGNVWYHEALEEFDHQRRLASVA